MEIIKVYNNNVIMVHDQNLEYIATGSGIGFSKRPGDTIDRSRIDKLYKFEDHQKKQFNQLMDRIPILYFKISEAIAQRAMKQLHIKMSSQILISLSDHIYYSVQRAKRGVIIPNFMLNEIKSLYEEQYKIGLWGLKLIRANTGIELDENEAGYIAMHISNATIGVNQEENHVNQILRFIKEVQRIIENEYGVSFEEDDLNTSRFITHLKFLGRHFFEKDNKKNEDLNELYLFFIKQDPKLKVCVDQIETYVKEKFEYTLEEYEKVYLMIHINKLVH